MGTVWLMYASDLRDGIRIPYNQCAVGLCNKFKEKGRRIWALPWLYVVQPKDLFHVNDISEAPL